MSKAKITQQPIKSAPKPPVKSIAPSAAPKSVMKSTPRSPDKQFTELVIKEIMVQKNLSREEALAHLNKYHK